MVYVNDMIVVGNNKHEKQILKESLSRQLKMKDLEKLLLYTNRNYLLKEKHLYLLKIVCS